VGFTQNQFLGDQSPRTPVVESLLLVVEGDQRKPDHSRLRFNVKTTWPAPGEVAPARGLCCPRPRGMSSHKPECTRRPLSIGSAGSAVR
jgi:hypothetical protein